MSPTYKCERCGVISDRQDHLCRPGKTENTDFCGSGPQQGSRICEPMAQHLQYQCSACGRPAEKPDLLCKPAIIR